MLPESNGSHRMRWSTPKNCYHYGDRRPTASEQIKREFIKFCQKTTIRGVSRVVSATDKRVRMLWLTFVILLFVGLISCIYILLRQYLSFDVIHPPRILRDERFPFPAITMCNLRPLSLRGREKLDKNGWKNPREFGLTVNAYAAQYLYRQGRKLDYQKISSTVSLNGYLESIMNGTDELGHMRKDFIINCQVMYLNGSKRVGEYCDTIGNWTNFIHAQYLNCYIFNLRPEFLNSTMSIEIFLYLGDDMRSMKCIDCFSADVKSQLSGAVLSIHSPNFFPDLNRHTINLQPGSLTEISLKTFQNIQKTAPYGRCNPAAPRYISLENKTYYYSEGACRLSVIQGRINRNCGCKAIEYPISEANMPFCSSLPSFTLKDGCTFPPGSNVSEKQCVEELFTALKNIACKSNITMQYESDVVPDCTMPCSFYSYESDRSTSSWPTKSWQLNWLTSRIGRKLSDNPELMVYKKINKLMQNDQEEDARKLLYSSNALEQNLLAILINRPNFNLHVVKEKEIFSTTSFLSQAGGLFSIWVGLTIFSVVEILEFLLRSYAAVRKSTACNKMPVTLEDTSLQKLDNLAESSRMLRFDESKVNGMHPLRENIDTEFPACPCGHTNKDLANAMVILKCRHCNPEALF